METVIKQWQEIQSDSIRIVDADGKTHNLIIAGSENAEQKTDYNSNSVEMSKGNFSCIFSFNSLFEIQFRLQLWFSFFF